MRVDVTVPGGELFATSDNEADAPHTDPYVALRDAFDEMRRQLEDYSRRQRGDVKRHSTPHPPAGPG